MVTVLEGDISDRDDASESRLAEPGKTNVWRLMAEVRKGQLKTADRRIKELERELAVAETKFPPLRTATIPCFTNKSIEAEVPALALVFPNDRVPIPFRPRASYYTTILEYCKQSEYDAVLTYANVAGRRTSASGRVAWARENLVMLSGLTSTEQVALKLMFPELV